MTIQDYLTKLNTLYQTGNAREHSYRGDLQNLLSSILPDILVTNEPARVACGAPDYVLTKKDIPVGYIEAKDIGVDLGSKTLKEQFDRYKSGLSNLIFTDYLEFHFYKDGLITTKITIGKLEEGKIVAIPENFDQFIQLIKNFALTISQTIKSPTKLAEMMAGKARLMADVIEKSLKIDDENDTISNLKTQMLSFQDMLIHDIDNKAFADIYAQTIAYGMFAARYHDPTLPTFSREEAATLIPKSNPFLRKLFQDIAGYDLDDRLVWIVEELVGIFLATDVSDIMKNFGRSTKQEDPVVHFYETFLASYSPALRKARGVWYTPQPVVNFIVRAVDDILKTEFGLKDGLADRSKIKVKVKAPKLDNRSKNTSKIIGEQEIEKEYHKVQILDPATGTGTFLAEVVRHIHKKFEEQQGIWSKYVNNDLIPRLNGFELLMASYAMAHLKMDMLLTETGYKPENDQRFRIFLTNSLEEHHKDTGTLFSHWLADEANQANAIKRDAPVMVVIGNPPYSVSSTNKSPWIEKLTADYKKDLKERNIQPLSDDYIKFIRFGQHFIDKNGEGILAYISNNSFIDGIIHRQMRKHLAESFDKIYIIDLHGNTRIKEIAPDGTKDENVFDIMAGVSINIFIKSGKKNKDEFAEIYNYDLFGKRKNKYNFLHYNELKTIKWNKISLLEPEFLMVHKDFSSKSTYDLGFPINQLFLNNNSGLATEFDELVIHHNRIQAEDIIVDLRNLDVKTIKEKYYFKDKQQSKIDNAKKDISQHIPNIYPINYRPFDKQYCIYTGISNGIMGRPRNSTMQHFIKGKNIGIIVSRTVYGNYGWHDIQITDSITEKGIMAMRVGNAAIVCPLYIYIDNVGKMDIDLINRLPNLSPEIVKQISKGLGLDFVPEKEENTTTFAPIDLLDYIYAVLHSPSYREKYKEFLKIDFPRVPYPTDAEKFWQLVTLGGEIRQIHLLESDVVEKYITKYPEDGDNIITKPLYKDGNVYINDTQYFSNVPEVAWNFYIGGYQPAQKWIKDRKGRELSYEDIFHYQKIIVALTETDRIMTEINKIEI
ncbi:type ISP restriction/modification enzyme [Flavobacterium suzhouense]|uniref:site-specific DNA-methyltransferase (adenine-specific) n=1 Tax=Flavobacterium suzhouense TaxID=1529638 RepID=A0ABW5NXU0_9FLAO